jgi:nucleoside-diphosphate-sugar epimerase
MCKSRLDRVLVTGASGTLGYNIVRHIATQYPLASLRVLMRKLDHNLFSDLPNVVLDQVDMFDSAAVAKAVAGFQPTAVIHCAASGVRPSSTSYFDLIQLNVWATLHLFRVSCELERCHFVHISTGLVYGNQDRPCREGDPMNTLHPYGASKAAADCLLRAGAERLQRHLTIVRPFSFTGLHDGGDRLFPSLLRAAAERKLFQMSKGTQIRDFCAVRDVAEAVALILEDGEEPAQDIFNVGSGLSISLGRLVRSVCRQLALDVEVRFGALPLHPLEPTYIVADISRIQALGWRAKTNLAYAVWQLARSQFPELKVSEPEEYQ